MKEDQSVPNFPWMSWSTLKLEGQLSILDGRGKFTTFQLLYDGLLFLANFFSKLSMNALLIERLVQLTFTVKGYLKCITRGCIDLQ